MSIKSEGTILTYHIFQVDKRLLSPIPGCQRCMYIYIYFFFRLPILILGLSCIMLTMLNVLYYLIEPMCLPIIGLSASLNLTHDVILLFLFF